jgi:hypothetical protein
VVLAFLLTPIVGLLEKVRFGRVASLLVVVVLFFALFVEIGWGITNQLVEILVHLPNYGVNIHNKIEATRATQRIAPYLVRRPRRPVLSPEHQTSGQKTRQSSEFRSAPNSYNLSHLGLDKGRGATRNSRSRKPWRVDQCRWPHPKVHGTMEDCQRNRDLNRFITDTHSKMLAD